LRCPKKVGAGVRSFESGQIKNANVDRGDGHARLLARREPREMNGEGHRFARPRELWRVELDIERVRTWIDGEPGQPKRTARHALRPNVEWAMGQRNGIRAGAPIGADSKRDNVVSRDEIDIDETLDLVADQRDRRLAGEGGGDAELGLFASHVVRLVEGHDHIVRRLGAGCSRTSRRRRRRSSPRHRAFLTSSRCAPQPTRPENLAGASAPMSIVPLAMRFDDLTDS